MAEELSSDDRKKIWGLHPNVFFMGMTSLLTDVSSEMIFTLIPLYLTNVLRAPMSIAGVVGGVSEGADAFFRMLSGWFIYVVVYLGFALSSTIWHVWLALPSWRCQVL